MVNKDFHLLGYIMSSLSGQSLMQVLAIYFKMMSSSCTVFVMGSLRIHCSTSALNISLTGDFMSTASRNIIRE